MLPMMPNDDDMPGIDTPGEYDTGDMPDTIAVAHNGYSAAVRTHEPVDQRLAMYRPADDIAMTCAMCVHYHADDCACHRVAGHIRPDYVCDLFAPANLIERAMEPAVLDGAYVIAKSDDAQQIVFGWANIAVTKSGEQTIDHHADLIDPDDLESAAYDFMLNARVSGEDHAGDVDATCIESVVFTKQKAAAMGIPDGIVPDAGWWVGFHIPDHDAYVRARDSKTMFSIEGTAVREPVDDVAKRDYPKDVRDQMAASGQAMPDGSFPIRDRVDLRDAIQSIGRAGNRAAAIAHITARARALDATDMLPEGWS